MQQKKWSVPTRILHLGLVLTVSAQLFVSIIMEEPWEENNGLGALVYNAHEIIGLAALFIVLLHWGWTIFGPSNEGFRNLFPWYKTNRKQLTEDFKSLKLGEFPNSKKSGGLIGFIHGLGFLAVTAIAISGGLLYLIIPEQGEPGLIAEIYLGLHEMLATVVWVYWIGHGGMAILHHVLGHTFVKDMFTFLPNRKLTHNSSIDNIS